MAATFHISPLAVLAADDVDAQILVACAVAHDKAVRAAQAKADREVAAGGN